ncbi:hypothetical protein FOZ60_007807 [Perkinsus olseni]|uniref:Uncharacterized protein n=1 Tax=Perkinsus olseni TaxID=32597 RepID=A0A7J6PF05_PEROL|nr:hypothetical protein FOZ60_007807 [Perkinsus olseni]
MAVDVEPLELGDLGSISIDLGSVAKALQQIAAHQNATAEKASASWEEIEKIRAQFEENSGVTAKLTAQVAEMMEKSDAMGRLGAVGGVFRVRNRRDDDWADTSVISAERLRELEGRDFGGLQGKIDGHDEVIRDLREKVAGVDPPLAKLELHQSELLSKFAVLENKVSESGDAVRTVKASWEGTMKPSVDELNGKVKELASTVSGVVEDVEHVRKDINQKIFDYVLGIAFLRGILRSCVLIMQYGDSLWSEIRNAVERVNKKEFKEVEQRIELNSAKWHERSKQLLTYTRDHILTAVACEFHQRRLQHHVFSLWFQTQWEAMRRRAAMRKLGKIFHDHQRAALSRWRRKAEFEGLREGMESEVSGAKQEVENLIIQDIAALRESTSEEMKMKIGPEELERRTNGNSRESVIYRRLGLRVTKGWSPNVSSRSSSSRASSPREMIEGRLIELREGIEAAFAAVREMKEVALPREYATKEMVLQCTRDALELHKLYQQLESAKADRSEMDAAVLETQNHSKQLDASIGGKVELLTTQLREAEEKSRKLEQCCASTESSLGEQKEVVERMKDTLAKLAEFTQELIDRFVGEGSVPHDAEHLSNLTYMVRTGGGYEPRHFTTLGASGETETVINIPSMEGEESQIDRSEKCRWVGSNRGPPGRYLKHARSVIERAASASSSRIRSSSGGRSRSRSRVFRTPPSGGGRSRELIQPAGAAVATPVGRYIRGVGFVHTN